MQHLHGNIAADAEPNTLVGWSTFPHSWPDQGNVLLSCRVEVTNLSEDAYLASKSSLLHLVCVLK